MYSTSMFWEHPCPQPLLNTLFILYLRLCALFSRTQSTQGISFQNCVGSFISWTGWLVQAVGSASNMGQCSLLQTALDWLNLLHDSLLLPLWSYYHNLWFKGSRATSALDLTGWESVRKCRPRWRMLSLDIFHVIFTVNVQLLEFIIIGLS